MKGKRSSILNSVIVGLGGRVLLTDLADSLDKMLGQNAWTKCLDKMPALLRPFAGAGRLAGCAFGAYCLKRKILLIIYNYRLKLSKKCLILLFKKGGKSLVFHYRDAVPLFLKQKVESGIRFLKSLLAGGFYYHSLRSRQKVESGKVSGDF